MFPGAAEAIKQINLMGLLAIVVSNQPGPAKGKFPLSFLPVLDRRMAADLAAHEAHLDAIYYCLHHPLASVVSLKVDCDCRKPRPGLLLKAAQEFGINLARSYMIGDRGLDLEAGAAAGCRTILVTSEVSPSTVASHIQLSYRAESLAEAVENIRERDAIDGCLP